jgi:methylated-DNA-[protein]-cysteine S-methyltransferase
VDPLQPNRTYDAVLQLPVPNLSIGVGVVLEQDSIVELDFLWRDWCAQAPRSGLAKRVSAELRDYFGCPTAAFSLPLSIKGTSYGALAQRLQSSPRAVGNACRSNPIPIIVPCHRVVAANGAIGGFAGQRDGPQLALKRWLLAHEANG